MTAPLVAASLTPSEYRLIQNLREVPETDLRTRVKALVDALVSIAREPRCAAQQADGVPCASVHVNCDQCSQVTRVLDGLEAMELQLRGFPG